MFLRLLLHSAMCTYSLHCLFNGCLIQIAALCEDVLSVVTHNYRNLRIMDNFKAGCLNINLAFKAKAI